MQTETVPDQADVVIIGGGIVGCSTAYFLAKRGAKVVVVEKGEVADEQSGRNWGWVRQQGRNPRELPLIMLSIRTWKRIIEEMDSEIDWIQSGSLRLSYSEEDAAHCETWTKTAQEIGLETKFLSAAEVREMVPALEGDYLGGAYTPSDGQAEPRKATQAVARAAQEYGANLLTYCAANRIELTAGAVSRVVTDKGTIKTPTVVCAAGAWSSKMGRMLGLNLPQGVVRTSVACTSPVPPITNTVLWGDGITVRQRADGRMYIAGGVRGDYDVTLDSFRHMWLFLPNFRRTRRRLKLNIGMDLVDDIRRSMPWSSSRHHPFAHTVDVEPKLSQENVKVMRRKLMEFIPSVGNINIDRAWAGRIDATPDATPVLGEVPGIQGFLFATGFSGHGFAMGPGAGLVTSELILDGKTSVDIRDFRYSRFKEGDLADWTLTI